MKAASGVAALLAALTLGMTWPLVLRLTSGIPGEYGDPLHAIWAMGWVSNALTNGLQHPSTLARFWDANIFFPEPRTLAFSEPFIVQSLMALPLYWISKNLILCYNAVFLSTFVLSGVGVFLLVRSLVARDGADPATKRAAIVAGVAAAVVFAFNRYRLQEVNHLAVLSTHWLPFALLGAHRYLVTDSRRALGLGALALVASSLSAMGAAFYGAAFAALFTIADAVRLKRWQLRVWLEIWAAAAAALVLTMPVLLPYLETQRSLGIPRAAFSFSDPALTMLSLFAAALFTGIATSFAVSRWPRGGFAAILAALVFHLALAHPGGMPLDRPVAAADDAPPPSLTPSSVMPPVYRAVASLSSDAVLLELPFGDRASDLRYMFFAASHGRRLVNGDSRVFPPSYRARQQVLKNPLLDPERTAQAISVATHIVVHAAAWPDGMRVAVVRQLEALGGTLLERDGDTVLYQMRATERVTERWLE
jgi:hypothetical protein